MRKFFINKKNNNKIVFSFNDNKHLKVLRIKNGDILDCFDDNGNVIEVKITNTNPYEGIYLKTIQENKIKPYPITCFLGVIKKNNFELAVEKLNELNIEKVIPVFFEFSQNNIHLNFERLKTIIDASCKQSNRFIKMELEQPIAFDQMINKLKDYQKIFLANEKENDKFSLKDINNLNLESKISFIVGPEGGFSKKELDVLLEKCESIRLTKTILRTETAAIYLACNLIERFYKNEK